MNTERSDFDRALRHWFEDGPTVMSDRVVNDIASRIARQPQRRTWRLRGRPFMSNYAKLAAATAAVLVIGLVGWQLLPENGGNGGTPTLAPTPTTLPSPTPVAAAPEPTFGCQEGRNCDGYLAVGRHTSSQFQPTFAYTTPANWFNALDIPNLYELDKTGVDDYMLIWSGVDVSQHTPTCDPVPEPGIGNSVADWIEFVTSHPALVASNPIDVDLGDAHGQVVDLNMESGWTKTCDGFPGTSLQFIMQPKDSIVGTYGAASWTWLRLYVLDVAGETVLITQYGLDADFVEITDSMRFTAPT